MVSMANATSDSEIEEEFLLNELLIIMEAMSSSNSIGWQQTIQDKYDSLMKKQTWELVKLPQDWKTIKCKWIFCHKLNNDGKVEQLKAWLVAKGYLQTYGIDYLETYALVAKLALLQLLISLAVKCNLKIHQMDIKSAFLAGDLNEVIYMAQPDGFIVEGGLVCKLIKSLYGLKQSPQQWNNKIHWFLVSIGFIRTNADHCVYKYYDVSDNCNVGQ